MVLIAFVLFICGLGYQMFTAPADDYDHQYYDHLFYVLKQLEMHHQFHDQKQLHEH